MCQLVNQEAMEPKTKFLTLSSLDVDNLLILCPEQEVSEISGQDYNMLVTVNRDTELIVHTNGATGYLKGQMQSSVMWYMCWITMEIFQTALNVWSEKSSIKEWFPVGKENGLGLSYRWWVLKSCTKHPWKTLNWISNKFVYMWIHVDTW